MDMKTFANRENKVLTFMEEVQEIRDREASHEEFQNSTNYKMACLNREREKAKGVCLDAVFSKIYKDAVPLNDDYKVARGEDLDAEIKDFINDRCPKGVEYYVKEGILKGSTIAKRIMEAVDDIVDDAYKDRVFNVNNYSASDMVFRMDDETQKKIDVMNRDLNIDDITQIIHDNVKTTAVSEITRAKKEKEDIKNLESELANDMNITSESAIDEILASRGFGKKKIFKPTLFQGIMIGNVNALTSLYESGQFEPEFNYNALSEFKTPSVESEEEVESDTSDTNVSIEEAAFIESVKELTKLNIVKALKLEKLTPDVMSEMASEYAYNK